MRGHRTGRAAEAFSAEGVARALLAIPCGQIGYRYFSATIASAGCVGYLVSLAGRRALCFGRTNDCHVEGFPGAGL